MKITKKIMIGILLGLILWICVFAYVLGLNGEKTNAMCAVYAETDHSKEIAESRRVWLLENDYDYNEDFDWYESCLRQVKKSFKHGKPLTK